MNNLEWLDLSIIFTSLFLVPACASYTIVSLLSSIRLYILLIISALVSIPLLSITGVIPISIHTYITCGVFLISVLPFSRQMYLLYKKYINFSNFDNKIKISTAAILAMLAPALFLTSPYLKDNAEAVISYLNPYSFVIDTIPIVLERYTKFMYAIIVILAFVNFKIIMAIPTTSEKRDIQ